MLKNSFAPVLQGRFDIVAGNPPWVNWEHLPESWRELSKGLWVQYGLFSLRGHAARLGGAKKDLAMLFTYACADHYLKPKGQLGFVITQTVFKTRGAGDGFRRFRLGEDGAPLRVKAVDDLSDLQPFEGATNRTAILTLIKGEPTRYPVPYTVWQRERGQRIAQESSLREASERCLRRNYVAEPVDPSTPTSPWLTANRYVLSALRKVIGPSAYRAYEGANTGGLNGVYWVRVVQHRPDGLVVIENLADVGKREVPSVRAAIEPDLLYPLLRGRDIQPWRAVASAWVILAQDPEKRSGWPEPKMKTEWPHTYRYLRQFEEQLRERSGFRQYFDPAKDPFWSMYNIGPYTLAPYKVVWKEVANDLVAAVVSERHAGRVVVPDHTVVFIPFADAQEAHFVCSLLASSCAQAVVRFYVTGHPSPHIMGHIRIPRFDASSSVHRKLADISWRAHEQPYDAGSLLAEMDRLAAEVWGLSERELRAVQRELSRKPELPSPGDGRRGTPRTASSAQGAMA